MKHLSTYKIFETNQSIVDRSQIDDVLKYIKSGCFGIISAFQTHSSIPDNEKRSVLLKTRLTQAKYQPIRIIGQWSAESNEVSYVVQKPESMTCREFEASLMKLAQDFNQDAIVFSRNGDVIIINTDGSIKDIEDDFRIKNKFVGFTFE